jgi:hypothetical protein
MLRLKIQVPICLAGSDTDSFLTAEPAIVVDEDVDEEFLEASMRDHGPDAASSNEAISLLPPRYPSNHVVGTIPLVTDDLSRPQRRPSASDGFSASDNLVQTQHGGNLHREIPPLSPVDHAMRTQHGITVRRAVNKCRRMSMMHHSKNKSSRTLDHMNLDEKSVISPFDRSSSRNLDASFNGSSPPMSPTSERLSYGRSESPHIVRVDSGHYT